MVPRDEPKIPVQHSPYVPWSAVVQATALAVILVATIIGLMILRVEVLDRLDAIRDEIELSRQERAFLWSLRHPEMVPDRPNDGLEFEQN